MKEARLYDQEHLIIKNVKKNQNTEDIKLSQSYKFAIGEIGGTYLEEGDLFGTGGR